MNPMRGFLVEMQRLYRQLRMQGPLLASLSGIDKLYRMTTGRPMRRFSQITPQLGLGGQPASHVWPRLIARGLTGVVNMREEYDYIKKVRFGDLRYLYLPTPDNTPPSVADLHVGVRFIRREIERGGGVYIHCWEGLGRGPTMAAAYFVSTGMSPTEALDFIRAVRPFIRPTPAQIESLHQFAAEYHMPPEIDEPITETGISEPLPPDPS